MVNKILFHMCNPKTTCAMVLHMWMFHYTCGYSISHVDVLVHMWMFCFTCGCSVSQVDVILHMWKLYFTCGCSVSHVDISYHMWMLFSHVDCLFHMWMFYYTCAITTIYIYLPVGCAVSTLQFCRIDSPFVIVRISQAFTFIHIAESIYNQ